MGVGLEVVVELGRRLSFCGGDLSSAAGRVGVALLVSPRPRCNAAAPGHRITKTTRDVSMTELDVGHSKCGI